MCVLVSPRQCSGVHTPFPQSHETTVSVVRPSPSALDVSHWQNVLSHPRQLEARACHPDRPNFDWQVRTAINDAASL